MRETVKNHRLGLARKVVDYARRGVTAEAPGVMQESVSFYLDREAYEREHRRFFLETPLVACLSMDIPAPGSFRLFDDAGVPIVVIRGTDGKARAFLNVCRHRGARVVREECGVAKRFTCRFHGWTFDTMGKAIGIPEAAQFADEIEDQKQLISVPAEERHGLVFVQATPGSTMDLDLHLGDLGPELEILDLAKATRSIEYHLEAQANWKYTLDTYFESYHVPSLHRDSFAKVIQKSLSHFETWGPHHRITWSHATIPQWMHKPEEEWPIETAFPISYFIFPNTSIGVGSASHNGSLISFQRVFPKSVGDLRTKVTICAPHYDETPEQWAEIERNAEALKIGVRDEDYSVSTEAFRGISALPPDTRFPIGRQEIGVQNFHRNIKQLLDA